LRKAVLSFNYKKEPKLLFQPAPNGMTLQNGISIFAFGIERKRALDMLLHDLNDPGLKYTENKYLCTLFIDRLELGRTSYEGMEHILDHVFKEAFLSHTKPDEEALCDLIVKSHRGLSVFFDHFAG
jgi:hypothetical protein